MTAKTIVIAGVMALAPVMSFAQCSKDYHETTASSCMEGQVWDPNTRMCVDAVTG